MMFKKIFFLIILMSQIDYSQGIIDINISTPYNVDFIIKDKFDRKTGVDPRGSGAKYRDIPGSGYGAENNDIEGDAEFASNVYNMTIISPQEDGTYSIKLIGKKLCTFVTNIITNPRENGQELDLVIYSFIDKDFELNYKFTYYGSPSTPSKLEKVVTAQTLIQDITTGGKLNLIGDQNFINSLIGNANRVATGISRGKGDYARRYLDIINTDVNNYYTNRTATNYVEKYAYDILIEDMDKLYAIINSISPPPIEQQRIKKP